MACALASVANLTTILVTAQLRHHGTAAVAAYGISARLEFLMIPLAFGVGSALTALVGRAVGAGDWHTARRTAWVGALLALLIAGLAGAAVGMMPERFASLFTQDQQVAPIAARALSWVGPALAASALAWRCTLLRWAPAACAGPWPPACAGSAWRSRRWLLANVAGMGLDGHFLGVAMGISAYGLVTALGVREREWSAR